MSAGSHNPVHLEFPHGGFVTLTIKGGFDSEAAYWFSYGLCATFALAVHRLTGWPIFCLRPALSYGVELFHAGVLSPSGMLDAYGPGVLQRIENASGELWDAVPIPTDELDYAEENLDAALPFVRAFLEKYLSAPEQLELFPELCR